MSALPPKADIAECDGMSALCQKRTFVQLDGKRHSQTGLVVISQGLQRSSPIAGE
jgi:hypothetical protein